MDIRIGIEMDRERKRNIWKREGVRGEEKRRGYYCIFCKTTRDREGDIDIDNKRDRDNKRGRERVSEIERERVREIERE